MNNDIWSIGIEISPLMIIGILICYIGYVFALYKKYSPSIIFLIFFLIWGCPFIIGGTLSMSQSFLVGLILCVCALVFPFIFMFGSKHTRRMKTCRKTIYEKDFNTINTKLKED